MGMTRKSRIAAALVGALACAGPAAGQQIRLESGPVELGLSGRVQVQFNTTSVDADDTGELVGPADATFETRRVRLALDLAINEWITGLIEPDFAMGRLQIRNAYIDLGFSEALALRAGQYKKPFSLIQLTSSSKIPMIERNVRIRGLADALTTRDSAGVLGRFGEDVLFGEEQYLLETLGYDSYDLGASLHGSIGNFGYDVGVFNGERSDAQDVNGSKSFAGRATYAIPFSLPLRVGGAVSVRDVLPADTIGTERGTAFGLDLELGEYRKGLWLLADLATGDNFAGGDFRGAQGVAAYYVPTGHARIEGVEPVFRASWGDPDSDVDDDAGLLLTPGLTLHFFGRNKLMFNWDWYLPQGDAFDTEHALRSQVQLFF
jgi:hypothetical protein